MLGVFLRVIRRQCAPQLVAPGVVLEGLGCRLAILERLSQGEMEMKAVLLAEVLPQQLGPHRLEIRVGEPKGLEVGKTPPGLAESRRQLETLPVGRDAGGFLAGGLERMAVAHPDLRLTGVFGQYPGVDLQRLRVLADPTENRALQVARTGVPGVFREEPVDLRQGLGGLVLAVQDHCIIVPCSRKARRQLQAADQEVLGIVEPPDPGSDLRQHPDCGDIGRPLLQVGLEEGLRLGNPVLVQRRRGLQKPRVVRWRTRGIHGLSRGTTPPFRAGRSWLMLSMAAR